MSLRLIYRQASKLEVKKTAYALSCKINYIDKKMAYVVMFAGDGEYSINSYWIDSRAANISGTSRSAYAQFGIRFYDEGGSISHYILYNSANEDDGDYCGLRPIVRLTRDVQISELGGTVAMPRTLSR